MVASAPPSRRAAIVGASAPGWLSHSNQMGVGVFIGICFFALIAQ